MIKRALVSVSDKTGIDEFVKALADRGIEIISTGGTCKVLKEAGIPVTGISEVTGFPECLDGRVKTLHPKIHAALLAVRDNPEHMRQLETLDIMPIDMVIVNLYPFKQTVEKADVTLKMAIEQIDIGGPSMLRSAAKNFEGVVVVTDPADYFTVLDEIDKNGDVSYETRFRLCTKVFEHTAAYDALIAKYMVEQQNSGSFPDVLTLTFEKIQDMRYGENPHQKAAFYKEPGNFRGLLPNAVQLHGKELSYNNIGDANGALELIKEFDEPAVAAVKHANPCGVATGKDLYDAYVRAYEADPVSIYGGILALNRTVDEKTATEINKIFIEIVIAPDYSANALEILKSKKNIRILKLVDILEKVPKNMYDMKKVMGGILVQNYDIDLPEGQNLEVVTKKAPTAEELVDLDFAMKLVKHTKSNGITVAKNCQSLGIGPGQVSRIMAAKIALEYAGEKAKGAVMASDAYLPFDDCAEAAAKAGITAIIQPGGSKNDQKSIDACDKYGIAMVMTGIRHFKH
ncbi:MAG: bifunctional phosphoribosylaminoimidazolecarboxamide formyltransferase/IMP cyclohydrolase [Clostridiales bacterium]|jgi:phosphoribosylaminoimidazolecarboxamide formyltransferase/IMP cyclohydrolase|nr:bifunctional phosphoribosylaminoimidazolecarboxamide formyltransferase/IMP cyclohydrolase [Clostridiales bacterium]